MKRTEFKLLIFHLFPVWYLANSRLNCFHHINMLVKRETTHEESLRVVGSLTPTAPKGSCCLCVGRGCGKRERKGGTRLPRRAKCSEMGGNTAERAGAPPHVSWMLPPSHLGGNCVKSSWHEMVQAVLRRRGTTVLLKIMSSSDLATGRLTGTNFWGTWATSLPDDWLQKGALTCNNLETGSTPLTVLT